jgi:hypothetical protein
LFRCALSGCMSGDGLRPRPTFLFGISLSETAHLEKESNTHDGTGRSHDQVP